MSFYPLLAFVFTLIMIMLLPGISSPIYFSLTTIFLELVFFYLLIIVLFHHYLTPY